MTAERIRRRFVALAPFLAGAEALTYGVGGLEQVAGLVGMAKETVRFGHAGTAKPDRDRTGTGAPQGRWPQTHDGFRSGSAHPPGRTGVAERPRGSLNRRCAGRARAHANWPPSSTR